MTKWLEIAEELPLGTKTRVTCCGKNRDAVISNDKQGYSVHCFKCGYSDRHTVHNRTLEQLRCLEELNRQPDPVEIPEDFTSVIPVQHRTWLYKAGITHAEYLQAGIGWSDHLQRIIIPLYGDSGELLYFQCRAVHKGQLPKYKNPPVEKATLLYKVNHPDYSRVVVTEDILSALKVGRHTHAVSILGTKTSDEQAAYLSEFKLVSYWLDPDKAGLEGARKGCKQLSLVTNTEVLHSSKDPKNLSDRVIRKILGLPTMETYTYHGCVITQNNETQELL